MDTDLTHRRWRGVLLNLLADGGFHSGQSIANQLRCSRTAVWKWVERLRELGIEVDSVRGKGYRLRCPLELLDANEISSAIHGVAGNHPHIAVLEFVDSTNAWLMKRARDGIPTGSVCLAEMQTAGRGRRGRSWASPYGANLYLSALWRFAASPGELMGLSLAVGVAIAETLADLGVRRVQLKWPNDITWNRRKLGGILIEFEGEAAGESTVVIGIGINVQMPRKVGDRIDQAWVDLEEAFGRPPSRNELAGRLLCRLIPALREFERAGWVAFRDRWKDFDCCIGETIRVLLPTGSVEGVGAGIGDTGQLLLSTPTGQQSFTVGEISVRMQP